MFPPTCRNGIERVGFSLWNRRNINRERSVCWLLLLFFSFLTGCLIRERCVAGVLIGTAQMRRGRNLFQVTQRHARRRFESSAPPARGFLIETQAASHPYLFLSPPFFYSKFSSAGPRCLPTHPPPTAFTSHFLHLSFSVRLTRELKHRATEQPNEPKFQIHDYIESQKQKSGCCGKM